MNELHIVGVDCATEPRKTGLALGIFDGTRVTVTAAQCASKNLGAAQMAPNWIGKDCTALIAVDAPLGWPAALSEAIGQHQAGDPLEHLANAMFRRLTDDAICARLRKRSLDVGADRIARTAHSALQFLKELRTILNEPIPLAWSSNWGSRVAAIEVYPAATRKAHSAPTGPAWFDSLPSAMTLRMEALPKSKDAQDAILCVLTATDFLLGRTVSPTEQEMSRAKREGWIWAAAAERAG
jgi:Protein of unknown function (DUF429)